MGDMGWNAQLGDIPQAENSSQYLGCLKSNFAGTKFVGYDYRVQVESSKGSRNSLEKKKTKKKEKKKDIHEICAIEFEVNMLGRVPNSMRVLMPRWDSLDAGERMDETLGERAKFLDLTRKKKRSLSSALGEKKKDPPPSPFFFFFFFFFKNN